jgi:FecR protein
MDLTLYRLAVVLLGIWLADAVWAGLPADARIRQRAGDVRAIDASGKESRVFRNVMIAPGSTIRTGNDSSAEVNFGEEIVVRLAANTSLAIDSKPGTFELKQGAVLVQASKREHGAKISAGNSAAAIGGATTMFEHHPGMCKFLVLEGTGRLYRPAYLGDSVLVGPGQMVIGNPNSPVSDPVDFDIARFITTSRLVVGLPALRSQASVATEIQNQRREKSEKALIDTNLIIYGGGTLVSLVDPAQLKATPKPKAQQGSSHE